MNEPHRTLPAVHRLLAEAERDSTLGEAPRQLVVDCIRAALARARHAGTGEPAGGWLAAVRQELAARTRPSLVGVVNATGVVLHTNLGRAPLAQAARRAAASAYGYCTLEFDLEQGERGSRQDHTRSLLREITGAEDGIVVTNAAAAVLLLLNTLADGNETIVSRGELVEIGGAFRIPEILTKSGSILVEVGTTNRTRRKDYQLAISPRTRLLLKVHQSNFTVTGFVEDTPLGELVELGRPRGIPVVHDIGSGLLIDLSQWGLVGEPQVQHSVATGATVVFSGDKLMGGPQAGIIVGPGDIIQRAAANPLARVLRPDKFTVAALEATLSLYRDTELAIAEIPTLAMLTADSRLLEARARSLAAALPGASTKPGHSAVGGGSFPGASLPTVLVTLPTKSVAATVDQLRRHSPPVIARAGDGAVLFDVRTIGDEEIATVVAAVAAGSV